MRKLLVEVLKILGLKDTIRDRFNLLRLFYFNYFTILGIQQNFNIKSIPIIIISFNQLFYLKKLIEFLLAKGYENIVVIDNNSTYKPLLDYFDSVASVITIHRLNENFGHLVFWKNEELFKMYSKGYYVVTDADIVPNENCPDDFLLHFKRILNRNRKVTKVGFSLKIDDIPDSNKNRNEIVKWESQFWKFKNSEGNFKANIDTTFALYRPNYKRKNFEEFLKAIRVNYPFVARHGGWYVDSNKLTHEQEYFISTANNSSSWLIDKNGNLINPDFIKAYQ